MYCALTLEQLGTSMNLTKKAEWVGSTGWDRPPQGDGIYAELPVTRAPRVLGTQPFFFEVSRWNLLDASLLQAGLQPLPPMSTRPFEGVCGLVREPEARPGHSQGHRKDLTGPRDTLTPTGLIRLSLGLSSGRVRPCELLPV